MERINCFQIYLKLCLYQISFKNQCELYLWKLDWKIRLTEHGPILLAPSYRIGQIKFLMNFLLKKKRKKIYVHISIHMTYLIPFSVSNFDNWNSTFSFYFSYKNHLYEVRVWSIWKLTFQLIIFSLSILNFLFYRKIV